MAVGAPIQDHAACVVQLTVNIMLLMIEVLCIYIYIYDIQTYYTTIIPIFGILGHAGFRSPTT